MRTPSIIPGDLVGYQDPNLPEYRGIVQDLATRTPYVSVRWHSPRVYISREWAPNLKVRWTTKEDI